MRRGSTSTTTLPTARMRTGEFSELLPDRVIVIPPQAHRSPEISFPPLGSVPLHSILSAYRNTRCPIFQVFATTTRCHPSTKTTWIRSIPESIILFPKRTTWGSFYWTKLDTASPRFTQINDNLQQTTVQAWSVDYTHIFSPHLINNLRAGFNYVSRDVKNRTA